MASDWSSSWDGTKTSGVFRGLQWTPAATYAAAYDVARAGRAPGLPRLGPGATLVTTSRKSVRGEYVGLGPGFVAFSPAGGRLEAFDIEQLVALTDASGTRIESHQVRLLLEQRTVPLVAAIAVEQPDGKKLVDSGEVASVTRLGRDSEAAKTGSPPTPRPPPAPSSTASTGRRGASTPSPSGAPSIERPSVPTLRASTTRRRWRASIA